MKKSIHDWFNEYGESHQNRTNKVIHWICVPLIFFSIVCLLSLLRIGDRLSVASVLMIFAVIFYLRLSVPIAIGVLWFYFVCLFTAYIINKAGGSLLWTGIIIFAAAWIGQFIGHKIEGKKPSFLKDIQFLLIGPAWLLSFIYRKLGIRY